MSTAITPQKQRRDISTLLQGEEFKAAVANALPKHLKPERFIRVAINALTRTPKLLECSQESFFRCLLDLSALGIEPDGRRAHLIPFGKECTLIIDYKGLAELAMRSGIISVLHADVVCENDESFEYDRGELRSHKINFRKPRGEMFAAYALVKFKDGGEKCDVMSKEEIVAIQRRSRSGQNGPWKTDFNEMAKKTVFRRLSKWLPLSAEFRDALDKDEDELEILKVVKETPQFAPIMNLGEGDTGAPADEKPADQPAGTQEETALQSLARMMKENGIEFEALRFFLRRNDDGDFKSMEEIGENKAKLLIQSFETIKGQLR